MKTVPGYISKSTLMDALILQMEKPQCYSSVGGGGGAGFGDTEELHCSDNVSLSPELHPRDYYY